MGKKYLTKKKKSHEKKVALQNATPTLQFFRQIKQSHECFTGNGHFTIPQDCYCPITLDIMKDPVIASDGLTYERSAIEAWFKNKNTSPSTGAPLTNKTLMPNLSLRNTIQSILVQAANGLITNNDGDVSNVIPISLSRQA